MGRLNKKRRVKFVTHTLELHFKLSNGSRGGARVEGGGEGEEEEEERGPSPFSFGLKPRPTGPGRTKRERAKSF